MPDLSPMAQPDCPAAPTLGPGPGGGDIIIYTQKRAEIVDIHCLFYWYH